jgi:hypothetical protein
MILAYGHITECLPPFGDQASNPGNKEDEILRLRFA